MFKWRREIARLNRVTRRRSSAIPIARLGIIRVTCQPDLHKSAHSGAAGCHRASVILYRIPYTANMQNTAEAGVTEKERIVLSNARKYTLLALVRLSWRNSCIGADSGVAVLFYAVYRCV